MGRKVYNEDERSKNISISLPTWIIRELKEMTNISRFIKETLADKLYSMGCQRR